MTKDEALKRGMELLRSNIFAQQWFELQPEITAIKEALAQPEPDLTKRDRESYQKGHNAGVAHHKQSVKLAQPEQEPVATVTSETGNPDVTMSWWHEPALPVGTKLYTTPPQRKPLTDEEIEEIAARTLFPINFARAIEAAHGIKENT